uniref:Uncharacterized protein n=1 Tax=Coptotermes formosanus TaxID=36987 RepID=R4V4C9_COPFO|nr:hypothetical protein [Coptotermes formosanus]
MVPYQNVSTWVSVFFNNSNPVTIGAGIVAFFDECAFQLSGFGQPVGPGVAIVRGSFFDGDLPSQSGLTTDGCSSHYQIQSSGAPVTVAGGCLVFSMVFSLPSADVTLPTNVPTVLPSGSVSPRPSVSVPPSASGSASPRSVSPRPVSPRPTVTATPLASESLFPSDFATPSETGNDYDRAKRTGEIVGGVIGGSCRGWDCGGCCAVVQVEASSGDPR